MSVALFPEIEPFDTRQIQVSTLHRIYVEQCGNPKGRPILFLHGGPGGGVSPKHRRLFDPAKWRVVLFDQRGCGKSTPHAELRENTTWTLVDDIERIRRDLGIQRWTVFGGSWGSTLGLAYAESHPESIDALVLRGIFLLRPQELTWFYQSGASRIFTDFWQDFLAPIPEAERDNLIAAYYKRLCSQDTEVRRKAARAWTQWEARTIHLLPQADVIAGMSDDRYADAFARIECHFFTNEGFFTPETSLLARAHRLASIPGHIVHGRYDVVCPFESAWDLHQAWPSSQLHIVPDAGHGVFEPGITKALMSVLEQIY